MPGKVGIAVVGAGSIGIRGALEHLVLPDAQAMVHIASICDPVPGRAKAAAEKYGAQSYYEAYEDLLADPAVDAVTICSPIGLHYQQAMQAIAAGKHVHLNKTMTTTKAEADDVIAAAKKAGVKVVASPGEGHRESIKRMKKVIESGEIGRMYWAETGRAWVGHEFEGYRSGDSVLSNVNPAWYYKRPGGGPMYDMTVYALHAITGLLGPAKAVTGMSGIGLKERFFKGEPLAIEMDDNTHLLLDFGDSVFCLIYGSNSFTGPARPSGACFVSGSQGALLQSRGKLEVWREGTDGYRMEQVPGTLPYVSGAHTEMGERHVFSDVMHLVDCIVNDREPAVSAEHARHVIEIVELGYKAAETGCTQRLTTSFVLQELAAGPGK